MSTNDKSRIGDDAAGFTALTGMLAEAGDSPQDPIPVAIETPRGLLVAVLRASGRPVFAINPMAVARYRERSSVARAKSDHADAMTSDDPAHRDNPHNPQRVTSHFRRRLPRVISRLGHGRIHPTNRVDRIRRRSGCRRCRVRGL